jgi:8-oxo-dGTP pyrophosphatase MutT (NUDIX family)
MRRQGELYGTTEAASHMRVTACVIGGRSARFEGAKRALAARPAGKLGVVSARLRHSVRGLVLDEDSCILLYRFIVPDSDLVVWAPPGGGVKDGESLLQALARELDEEIGLPLTHNPVHVWHQRVEDPDLLDAYDGVINDYYLIRAKRFVPHGSLSPTQLAAELVGEFDWWSVERLHSHRGEDVFGPRDLPRLLAALIGEALPAQPIAIGP